MKFDDSAYSAKQKAYRDKRYKNVIKKLTDVKDGEEYSFIILPLPLNAELTNVIDPTDFAATFCEVWVDTAEDEKGKKGRRSYVVSESQSLTHDFKESYFTKVFEFVKSNLKVLEGEYDRIMSLGYKGNGNYLNTNRLISILPVKLNSDNVDNPFEVLEITEEKGLLLKLSDARLKQIKAVLTGRLTMPYNFNHKSKKVIVYNFKHVEDKEWSLDNSPTAEFHHKLEDSYFVDDPVLALNTAAIHAEANEYIGKDLASDKECFIAALTHLYGKDYKTLINPLLGNRFKSELLEFCEFEYVAPDTEATEQTADDILDSVE